MKFSFALLAFVASTFAQVIRIDSAGATFAPGSYMTVSIIEPVPPTNIQDVSIVLGLTPCGTLQGGCASAISATESLGTVLHAGPFDPQVLNEQQIQTFKVHVPPDFPVGDASLNVAHFVIIGASAAPFLDIQNVTVNIASG